MSLATRCTSCGTVFRVVQDQLKVSEGWVRCGRCNEVFNALEGLFDLDRDSPAEWSGPPPSLHRPDQPFSVDPDLDEPEQRDPSLVDKIDAQLLSPRRSGFGALAGLAPAVRRHQDFADARFDTDLPADSAGDLSLAHLGEPEPTPDSGDAGATPEFVREAEKQARWRGSRARMLLLSVVVLLSMGLALQIGHHRRDRLAAIWSPARPALTAWCDLVGCTVGAPLRIEEVSVESTALTRASGPDAFRLSVVLRNRATTLLTVPWIDLTLTDASGQLVARRALSPQDFRVSSTTLAAGSELAMQVLLSAGSGRVTGYTVEIFYP
jgi:predicted Zn finger-like uncharacterized protein